MKIELLLIVYAFLIRITYSDCLTSVNDRHTINLVKDYFIYKNTTSVVLFTCNDIKDDISLVKLFNKRNIKVLFANLVSHSIVEDLIHPEYSKLGVFINLKCYDNDIIIQLFLEASRRQWYGEMHFWLILGVELGRILTMIKDVQFNLSTDFSVAIPRNTTADYQLFDIYNPWKDGGGEFNVTLLGFWNLHNGLNVTLKQSKFVRRSNLRGITMKAAFFGSKYRSKNKSLVEHLQDYATGSKDGLSKFGYSILTHLSEMFNITFNFKELEFEKWKPGDTVGPMSRYLANQEIQITGTPIIMSLGRLRLTKFVYPTWPFRTCFIFRNPQPQSIKLLAVLRPLSTESWFFTSITLMIFFVILGTTLRFEKEDLSINRFSNAFLLVSGTVCQQGTHFTFSKISSRILFLHFLIFCFLIYTYYSAFIVSARLNEPIVKINESLNELAKTDLKFGSEPMIYFDFILKKIPLSEKKLFYDRWLKIPENERFLHPDQAIPMVKKGGFAYHSHPDASYPIINRIFTIREICELTEVHMQLPSYSTLAVSFNSTFVEMAKIGFAKMSEVGIRKRQLLRWTSSKPVCQKNAIDISSTDIYEFAPHLIILFIGMLVALVILYIEKTIADYTRKKRIKKNQGHSPILVFADILCNIS